MNNSETILEFNKIKELLCNYALSEKTIEKFKKLSPYLNERKCKEELNNVTEGVKTINSLGQPPLGTMKNIKEILNICIKDGLLTVEQLLNITQFTASCKRMKLYLEKSSFLNTHISSYSEGIFSLENLNKEISSKIRNMEVDDYASKELQNLRKNIESTVSKIQEKLNTALSANKNYLADNYATVRNGRHVIPVKKDFKNKVNGIIIDTSRTGSVCFIEPKAITELTEKLLLLEIEEENEVRRILYVLTSEVENNISDINSNMELLEELDFVFAKSKLSIDINGVAPKINVDRKIIIKDGRHPLIDKENCVPLDFEFEKDKLGVVITGPNTGGKTVALKTIGLLSMMAQSGLHIPAKEGSSICMNSSYYCDIGDGQNISENLSTFSSHIKNIIFILNNCDNESLILLDELGSGTDPTEGMGIAVSILHELENIGCLFVSTTHYPEVKNYADSRKVLSNARMLFDPKTFKPLYKMEIGKAGESCALEIARQMDYPKHLLDIAYSVAYSNNKTEETQIDFSFEKAERKTQKSKIMKQVEPKIISKDSEQFEIGDSVILYPTKENGIIFQVADDKGDIGVQIKKKKSFVNHKRLEILIKAKELYPDDYDFSIIFDSVENRKTRKKMTKGHNSDLIIKYD